MKRIAVVSAPILGFLSTATAGTVVGTDAAQHSIQLRGTVPGVVGIQVIHTGTGPVASSNMTSGTFGAGGSATGTIAGTVGFGQVNPLRPNDYSGFAFRNAASDGAIFRTSLRVTVASSSGGYQLRASVPPNGNPEARVRIAASVSDNITSVSAPGIALSTGAGHAPVGVSSALLASVPTPGSTVLFIGSAGDLTLPGDVFTWDVALEVFDNAAASVSATLTLSVLPTI